MSFLCSFCAARVESFCHQRHRGSNKMEVNGLFNNVFVWFLIYLSNKRTLFTTQNSSIGGSYLIIRNFHFQLNYTIESKRKSLEIMNSMKSYVQVYICMSHYVFINLHLTFLKGHHSNWFNSNSIF